MTRNDQMVALSVALEPPDFTGLPYSPALLLDGRFGAAVTDQPGFARACEAGFEDYAETFLEDPPPCGRFSLVAVFSRVRTWVVEDIRANKWHPPELQMSLPWGVGFTLGWLSALALCQYQEAENGLLELQRLYQEESESEGLHV